MRSKPRPIGVMTIFFVLVSGQAFAQEAASATCPVPALAALRQQVLKRINTLGAQLAEVQDKIQPITQRELDQRNKSKALTAAKWSLLALGSGMVLNRVSDTIAAASAAAGKGSGAGVNAMVSARQAINSTLGVITLVKATKESGQLVMASHAPSLQEAMGRLDGDFEMEWYPQIGKGFEATVDAYERGREQVQKDTLALFEKTQHEIEQKRKGPIVCAPTIGDPSGLGCEVGVRAYRLINWDKWDDQARELEVLRSGLQAETNLLNDEIEYMVRTYGRVDEHCRHARAQLAQIETQDPRMSGRTEHPRSGESATGMRSPARERGPVGPATRAR